MTSLTVHGVKVPVGPQDVSPAIWRALHSQTYEAKEAKWISKAVKPRDRVLELESGIGIITALIAKIPEVRVWAFEANPATAALAERVIAANDLDNVKFSQGILTAGPPRTFRFYVREDLWMSSMERNQGPYQQELLIVSDDVDRFIARHQINVVVMDIEGAEKELLQHAKLPCIERIFLEFHDHLYGLDGIRQITMAMAAKGFAYDPRGSRGPCVLFAKNDGPREYEDADDVT